MKQTVQDSFAGTSYQSAVLTSRPLKQPHRATVVKNWTIYRTQIKANAFLVSADI